MPGKTPGAIIRLIGNTEIPSWLKPYAKRPRAFRDLSGRAVIEIEIPKATVVFGLNNMVTIKIGPQASRPVFMADTVLSIKDTITQTATPNPYACTKCNCLSGEVVETGPSPVDHRRNYAIFRCKNNKCSHKWEIKVI